MASIRSRKNKDDKIVSYQIRVSRGRDSLGNQLKPFSLSLKIPESWSETKGLKEANKAAILFEKECSEGLIANEKQTFERYAAYVMKLKERNQKHRTVERYYQLLERILPAIGHIKLSEIRPQHLNQFYDNISGEGQNKHTGGKLSNKTILEHHRLISTIMSQAEKELLIPYNPAHRATPPKITKQQANYFQIDDVYKILECLDKEALKWKTMAYMFIFTGCRRGEILGLKWDKVDFSKKTITIDNTILRSETKGIYEETTKTGKSRTIMLPAEAMQILKEYKVGYMKERLLNGDRWEDLNYVFVQDNGLPMYPDSITNWFSKFAKKYDLPHINVHAFRHTYASILISKGIDIVTVSKMLGHAKPSTTMDFYAELMKETSEKASDCMAEVLLKSYNK